MKSLIAASTLGLGLVAAATANATLIDRGGGLIYDTDFDITWLADANYAETSGFDADGAMTWSDAMTWVGNLSYGGYTDWRLPVNPQSDPACSFHYGDGNGTLGTGVGNNCTGGEMGHLYTELGGESPESITAIHNANYDLFQNIQSNNNYWSGTTYAPNSANLAFSYLFGDSQTVSDKANTFHAWAVRDGDVVVVPEPATGCLLGLGLLGLAGRGMSRLRRPSHSSRNLTDRSFSDVEQQLWTLEQGPRPASRTVGRPWPTRASGEVRLRVSRRSTGERNVPGAVGSWNQMTGPCPVVQVPFLHGDDVRLAIPIQVRERISYNVR